MKQPLEILRSVFGYPAFRPLQKEIIDNVLNGNDTLAIMPTGGGKSLCYQIPALMKDGLTLVVSPLISLMQDQVSQLNELGIEAVVLNSSLNAAQYRENFEKVRSGKAKLLYLAPETLLTDRVLELLDSIQVDLFTIDEAHCISEWGHDFRPEFRQLAEIRTKFPKANCLALTATATPRVQDDIIKSLNFKNSNKFVASFNRENLFLQIVKKNAPFEQTVAFLRDHHNQSGIIYCFSRKQVDELSADLENLGFSVKPYHAGLSDDERKVNQELFIKDDVQIIVATVAFGMGINKPNVRFVLHYDLPKNIESYYQEIGRAGRDGLKADCLMLFTYSDLYKINYIIDQKKPKEKKIAKKHLDDLISYAESYECRRKPLLNYFGEDYAVDDCGMCDNCLKEHDGLSDLTVAAQKFLSCIKRTGQLFGAEYIAQILLGSKIQRIFDKGHDSLSTYGIGKEYAKEQWLDLAGQFIRKGIIRRDFEYGSLIVTELGDEVLAGKRAVKGKIEKEKFAYSKAKKAEAEFEYDKELFEILRKFRKEIADDAGIPPYIVFPDKTLIEMAAVVPKSLNEMSYISGVGEVKLEKYGDEFLDVIQNFTKKVERIPAGSKGSNYSDAKAAMAGRAFESGLSIGQLIKQFESDFTGIIKLLRTYVEEGNEINSLRLISILKLSPGQVRSAMSFFQRKGVDENPAKADIGFDMHENGINLLRIHFLNSMPVKN